MNRLVFDDKERVNLWIYQLIGRGTPFSPTNAFNAFGVEDETGELIAGVVFDAFVTGVRCSMHCAGVKPNWCSRELLKNCFHYVFNTAKCKVIVNTVSSDNEKSIRFTKHCGFEEVGRVKDGAKDADLVIFALHKEKCKWI